MDKVELRRHKIFSFINIAGLSLGIACCLWLFLYVHDELSFDRFHENADRIFRVLHLYERQGQEQIGDRMPWGLAQSMREGFPEVERAVGMYTGIGTVKHENELYFENVTFAHPDFFELFSFVLLEGESESVLRRPDAVVLSETMARKYFGHEDALGRTLSLKLRDTFLEVTVTGVAARVPGNSSIDFDILVPLDKIREYGAFANLSWDSMLPRLFVQLQRSSQVEGLEAKFPDLLKTYAPEKWWSSRFVLQPLTEIHLTPGVGTSYGGPVPSNPRNASILACIAVFILLIACLNFVMLSTGYTATRAREIGIRKVLGAHRGQLIKQFLGEALVTSFVAALLGLAVAVALLPAFNRLAEKSLRAAMWSDPGMLLALLGLAVFVGLITGSAPAVYSSRLRPIAFFQGRSKIEGKGGLTYMLVVVQFVLSIILIVCTLFMWRQRNLLQTKDLGLNDEHVVRIASYSKQGRVDVDWDGELSRYREALAAYPEVLGVSGSWQPLGAGTMFGLRAVDDGQRDVQAYAFRVDRDFIDLLDIDLLAGTVFTEAQANDPAQGVIVNEALVKAFGWEDPLSENIDIQFIVEGAPVVGVVRDFHFQSLHHPVRPLLLYAKPEHPLLYFFVRIAPGNVTQTLARLENAWRQINPDVAFDYSFLDEEIARYYEAEKRWSRIVTYASILAIFIACLGIFGLTLHISLRRVKEISIRKVLGASVSSLVLLLTKRLFVAVGLAFLLACPVAYLVMDAWLADFAFRVAIDPGTFFLAGLLALLVASATASYQSIRSSLVNAAETLRHE